MDNVSQQVLEDMEQMVYDVMRGHQSYIYQQDLRTMDRMVNNLMRSCDLSHRNSIPAFVNFLLGSSIIHNDDDDDVSVDHNNLAITIKKQDLDITNNRHSLQFSFNVCQSLHPLP